MSTELFHCLIMIPSGVSVPPGPPAITSDLSGGVFEEGQTVHFTCSSSGGNPPPTVTWMKNGVELLNVAPGQTTTEGSTTRNVLSVTMDHSDHQANYTCFVYNTVNENSPLIAYKILNVRCEFWGNFPPLLATLSCFIHHQNAQMRVIILIRQSMHKFSC